MTSGRAASMEATILRRNHFLVVARRWRNQGPVLRPCEWAPIGVADRRDLAQAMVAVLHEKDSGIEARAVSAREFLHGFRAEECERILERLNGRTTVEIERDLELRWVAAARLADQPSRRSGRDRRSGGDRGDRAEQSLSPGEDRRTGGERRSGTDRRVQPAA
jgi:uncharacterized protein YbjT (DUF2867 family)